MMPLVSILIRTKDRPERLLETLNSVDKQSYRPIEVIIVNDAGIDVKDSLTNFFKPSSLSWFYDLLPNHQGRSSVANHAMSLAKGELLLFLDDDDVILEDHIANLFKTLQESPPENNLIGVYSGVQCATTSSTGELIPTEDTYYEHFDPIKLAYQNYLPIHSVLFKRTAYEKGCRFNEHLDLYEDWNFWLQVIQHGGLKLSHQLSAYYRLDDSGIGQPNTNKNFNDQWFLFIEQSKAYFTTKQLNHLLFSAKELLKCQNLLTECQTEKDQYPILESQSQASLSRLQKDYDKLEQVSRDQSEQLIQLQASKQALENKEALARKEAQEIKEALESKIYFIESRRSWKVVQFFEKIATVFKHKESLMPSPNIAFYLQYLKAFFRLLLRGQFAQTYQKIKGKFKIYRLKRQALSHEQHPEKAEGIEILATKHTLYVAELIKESLIKVGKRNVTILDPDTTNFSANLHFVVCPQMFQKLPSLYIAFQMEQSVSSRWFTKEYFQTLENSYAIMDYSQNNIRFLQEEGGLSYKQIFWTPISNIRPFRPDISTNIEPSYDVVFYGDPNNSRRQLFLKTLQSQFSVLVISEVFGDELYRQLQRGKVVVNIHYYENALLETTRIYECLSLNLKIISESSSDIDQHLNLMPYVSFTTINDIEAMCRAVQNEISRVTEPSKLPDDNENFHYFFSRMLTAVDLLPTDNLRKIPNFIKPDEFKKRIVLTLPETFLRNSFIKETLPDSFFFPGLRHFDGWLGAAMSFKYLSERAIAAQVPYLEICEDDVLLDNKFDQNCDTVKRFLFEERGMENWDIFCGLIADIHDNTVVSNVFEFQGLQFIELDKMTSMVYNIYSTKALRSIANWDATNRDVNTNTIDRYLEKEPLKVIVTLPYLVGHLPEHTSSIWHFKNSTYDDLIKASEVKLETKVKQFLANQ